MGRAGGTVPFTQTATLDAAGQRVALQDTAGSTMYGYDGAGRLTSASYPGSSTEANSYDQLGDRTIITSTTVLSGTAVTTNTFDAAAQLTSSGVAGGAQPGTTTYSYDGSGNQTGSSGPSGVTTNSFDQQGRLTHVVGPGTDLGLVYDGQGDRLRSYELGGAAPVLRDEAQDLVGGMGTGPGGSRGLSALVSDGRADYAYLGPGDGSAPLAGYTPSTSRSTYLATDLLGSVRLATDPSGATIGAGGYDAWDNARPYGGAGGTTLLAGLQASAPFGYAGQQYDAGPGTYGMRARQYDPAQGRFQSTDPQAPSQGYPVTLNPYQYAGDMVTGTTDPSGRGWLPSNSAASGRSNQDAGYETQLAQYILGHSTSVSGTLSEEEVPVYATADCSRRGTAIYSANLVRADGGPSGSLLGGQVWDMEHVQAFRGSPGPLFIGNGIRTHLIDNARKNGLRWSTNPACNGTYNHCGPYQEQHAVLRSGGDFFDTFGLQGTQVSGGKRVLVFPLADRYGALAVFSGGPGLILYDVLPPQGGCGVSLSCLYKVFVGSQVEVLRSDSSRFSKGLAVVGLAGVFLGGVQLVARGARLGAKALAASGEVLDLLGKGGVARVVDDAAGADVVAREAAYNTNGAAGLFDIEPLKDAIMRIRAALRSKPRREGNMAVAELHVDGLPPQVAAHSGIGAPTAAQQALGLVGAAGNDFKTFPVANRQGDLISRARDSEANILGYAAQQLGDNTAATGTINIFTELVMCASCRGVVDQFMEKYPGIQVNVLDNADIRLIPPKQVP